MQDMVMIEGRAFFPWAPAGVGYLRSGGVYCFAQTRRTFAKVTYEPLYWGIADDFAARFFKHDQWAGAYYLGMDTVLIHYEDSETHRLALERHLIQTYPTILNKQHNTAWGRAGALANALASDPWSAPGPRAVDVYMAASGRAVDVHLPPSRLPETRGARASALMNPFLPVPSKTTATRRALARALDAGALFDEAWTPVR